MTNWHHYSWNHNHPFGWHSGTASTLQENTHLLQWHGRTGLGGFPSARSYLGNLREPTAVSHLKQGWEEPVSVMPEELIHAQDIWKWPF